MTFLKCLITYYFYASLFTFCNCIKSDEKNNEDIESPSDIASVSKFIKEFHRKLEEDLYPIVDYDSSNDDTSPPYINDNVTNAANRSDKNVSSLVNCNTERKLGGLTVELVNSTRLVQLLMPDPNITHRLMEAECVVLLFYSRTCPFSCLAAPHFNALPRAFPSIKIAAVNAMIHQSFNTQYGVAGVPTVMLFHNGKAVAKFNDSEYTLKMFARFIVRFTDLGDASISEVLALGAFFSVLKPPDSVLSVHTTPSIIRL
ncbi:thioredoxin domain-containing protein bug isoform X2 [Rhodnius prolixus]|uniref:thioredoxin domain-containing protein bug isoform X2 n=1 Tax=Rhodnius prolixus TaxID=13249 RepID=UPI003D189752